jgi:catechol 2,3-dioxygenase-like lactoylglutathione lyase family enzyme
MLDPDPRELAPITVEMFVPDVDASIRFYTEKLGFKLLRQDRGSISGREQATFAIVVLEGAVMLIAHESLEGGPPPATRGGAIHVRIMVEDVDVMYRHAREGGVAIVSDIADRDYGLRDFIIRDPDGFRVRFASPMA